jgi:predicted nucleic acid-binding protein
VIPAIFIDTSYFLALINSRDKYHEAAKAAAVYAAPPFVTSEAVLFELGNALARPPQRNLAIQTLQQIRADANIEIIHIDPDLFAQTIAFYRARPDKGWGLTDCASFVIMRQRGLVEALTADKHFEQAGYTSLLKATQ